MNTKVQKIGAIILALTMTVGLFYGCGPKTEKTEQPQPAITTDPGEKKEATTPTNQAPTKLTLFLTNKNIVDGSYAKTEIEKATNTILEITQVPTKELDNKLNMVLASGNIPDIIQCETETMEGQLLAAGILLPINQYWEEYPNIKNGRTEEKWEKMRYKDGNIYSIGIVNPNPLAIIAYREDWLKKFNTEVPTTLDEYYEFAKKVALEDPDGNGKNDTFAFGGYQKIDVNWFDHIFGAYGALPNYWMEQDGRIVNGSIQPEMKNALIYLNKLYKEGIIDPEFVTDDPKRWQQKVKSGVYGAGTTKIHIFDHNNWSNYYHPLKQAYPEAEHVYGPVLKGGSEHPVGVRRASERGWLRTFIYKDSPNKEAALRLIDYLMSEEGNKFTQYGKEGEHYKYEGKLLVQTKSEKERQELDLNKFFIGNTVLFEQSSPELFDAFEYSQGISIDNPIDGLFIDELTSYYPKLRDLTNIRYIEMIVGETPIETGFDNFVKEWQASGGDKLTEAVNQAYQQK